MNFGAMASAEKFTPPTAILPITAHTKTMANMTIMGSASEETFSRRVFSMTVTSKSSDFRITKHR